MGAVRGRPTLNVPDDASAGKGIEVRTADDADRPALLAFMAGAGKAATLARRWHWREIADCFRIQLFWFNLCRTYEYR
jgi:hypothetical protein